MEPIAIYLLKSCCLLLLFFIAYHCLLRKETFFTANRWFLLAGLVTAVVLPLVVFTQIVWVDPNPVAYDWSSFPKRSLVDEDHTARYIYIALALAYSLGALGLLTKFGVDFYSLRKIVKGQNVINQDDFKFIDSPENRAPFSFFKTIVYNSNLYTAIELRNIIEHEKVHSEQYHSADVLIGRLFCILFWFNPIVWMYKKAMIQNLEFIADSEALKKISDKKAYQITLLKITTQEHCVALTNPFYQSLIKKRIVMLNKNQSHQKNAWKYTAILPALVGFTLFYQVEVVAQVKAPKESTSAVTYKLSTTSAITKQDSIKKTKKIEFEREKSKNIDPDTDIYIDGKKVTKKELDSTDPNTIESMNVTKGEKTSTIQITTQKQQSNSISIFENNQGADKLDLEKTDPTNLTGKKGPKGTYTVKKVYTTTDKNAAPQNAEYYVNGKKVSALEAEALSPNDITSVDVKKNGIGMTNSINIITKSYVDNRVSVPEPPTPPTPPTFNFKTPKAPNFPKAPTAPKGSPDTGDKKAWANFEKKMEEFEKKMKLLEPEIAEFDKKMEEFDRQMEPFNAKMKIFEKQMEVYEKQMQAYQAKLKASK
ncbi:M56 family metallopeptidase [Flavobacterium sp. F-380]|uniref:M56 family metallopeptidase n=1 Tax=Flavobacterium kayseriense TaxID=2764714 RepID=A0ABR7JAC3_9FLAO|nr:M56 family metallopeptidase [Flavobacterium kayseriense]MBC5842455.1 M56 family metallopeptidase [Flavobacterium kayseriense]MBC5848985.1 M56 family metallopeptidase [Flavobacterium kayseriense]